MARNHDVSISNAKNVILKGAALGASVLALAGATKAQASTTPRVSGGVGLEQISGGAALSSANTATSKSNLTRNLESGMTSVARLVLNGSWTNFGAEINVYREGSVDYVQASDGYPNDPNIVSGSGSDRGVIEAQFISGLKRVDGVIVPNLNKIVSIQVGWGTIEPNGQDSLYTSDQAGIDSLGGTVSSTTVPFNLKPKSSEASATTRRGEQQLTLGDENAVFDQMKYMVNAAGSNTFVETRGLKLAFPELPGKIVYNS